MPLIRTVGQVIREITKAGDQIRQAPSSSTSTQDGDHVSFSLSKKKPASANSPKLNNRG